MALATHTAIAAPDTWRLDKGTDWTTVSAEQNKYLLAVAEAKRLVNTGQTEPARQAYNKLKTDFPEIAGPDVDVFLEAEMLYSEGKFTKAVRAYNRLLVEYPDSALYEAVLDREFQIATAFLGGHKRRVLKFFKASSFDEGVKVMEKITERAGDTTIGKRAAFKVAKKYEEKARYNEAFLKWTEISAQWTTGQTGKESLLGKARCKQAIYNKHLEDERPMYDASSLISAGSYYKEFRSRYPGDANEIKIGEVLSEIDEQLALKQYSVGHYYLRTGKRQAANLYFDLIVRQWPNSKAAKLVREKFSENAGSKEIKR